MRRRHDRAKHLFDKPENVTRSWRLLCAACVTLFLADLIYHRHVTHPWESFWGFYGVFGFIGIVLLILAAKQLRRLVKRREDYYDLDR